MAKIWGFEDNRRNVISVITDWFYSSENGEEYGQWEVGKNGVVRIDYHKPQGEGDRHYINVYKEDGTVNREFNINSIKFGRDLRD